jgi:hypothetical protein
MMERMKRYTRLVHSVIERRDKSGSKAFKLPPFGEREEKCSIEGVLELS